MIAEIKEVNINPGADTSFLTLYSQTKGTIRGIFNPECRLTQYNLLTYDIEATEVLTKQGRDVI